MYFELGVLCVDRRKTTPETHQSTKIKEPSSSFLLGGSKGVEPSPYAVTVRRSAVKLRPTEKHCRLLIANCRLPIWFCCCPWRLELFGLLEISIGNRQSAIGNDLAGTTRLELANQLIEGQPAFHFAFIPRKSLLARNVANEFQKFLQRQKL